MEKRPMSLRTQKKKKTRDLCPVCDGDLYYNEEFTQRIGILNTTGNHELLGWICPHCKSEFDNSSKVMYIYGENYGAGDT